MRMLRLMGVVIAGAGACCTHAMRLVSMQDFAQRSL